MLALTSQRALLLACALVCAPVGCAWAQLIPPSVTPGQIQRGAEQRLPEQRGAEISVPAPSSLAAPANAAQFQFPLAAVEVEGVHALTAAAIAGTYQGLIGRKVSLADIYGVANAITAIYAKQGYALSFATVPAQTIDGSGRVRIEVVEGYVDEIVFTGDTRRIPLAVRAYAERIKQSRPLRTADIERFLLLIHDIPGVTVTSVFERPAAHSRGATRLAIHVALASATALVSFDNRGSRAVGRARTDDSVSLNSVLGLGDSLRLRLLQTVESRELSYGSATWSVPVGADGAVVSLSGDYFHSEPGTPLLSLLGYSSHGWTSRGELEFPAIRGRGQSLWLHGGLVAKELSSDFAVVPNSRDRLFEANLGATWWEDDATGSASFGIDLLQGLPAFGATTSSSPLRSRLSGSGQFTLATANATRVQRLGGGFELYGAVLAQVASRGLLTAEQCGYGGVPFGRGFDSSEIAGDDCLQGSLELRFRPRGPTLGHVQVFAFADAGKTWLNGPLLPTETRSSSGQSAGAGLRIDLTHGFFATAEFDQPFSRDVALEGNRKGRFFFTISKAL
jgi:hemolysin activation/secretion protein